MLPSAPSATLGGTGNVGSISVGAGRLAPGLSPGLLTSRGLGIGAGFPLAIELNGTTAGSGYDQVRVIGEVYIGLAVARTQRRRRLHAAAVLDVHHRRQRRHRSDQRHVRGSRRRRDGRRPAAASLPNQLCRRRRQRHRAVAHRRDQLLPRGRRDRRVLRQRRADRQSEPGRRAVTLTFLLEGGSTIVETRTVAAQSRMTVNVDSIPGLESASASVQVTSTSGVPLVVERTMSWDSTHYGGHTANAVANPDHALDLRRGFSGILRHLRADRERHGDARHRDAHVPARRRGAVRDVRAGRRLLASRRSMPATIAEIVNRAFGIVVDSHGAGDRRARDVFRERARKALGRRSRQHGDDDAVDDVVSRGGGDGNVLQHVHPVEQSVFDERDAWNCSSCCRAAR